MGLENTPLPSPGVGGLDKDDQIYDDEIAEKMDIGDGTLEVSCYGEQLFSFCDASSNFLSFLRVVMVSYFTISLG